MLDKAELDFGIYRIMNQKRKDIEQFLEKDLVPQVKQILAENLSFDKQALQKELEEAINAARTLGADPDTLPKVQQIKARLGEAADLVGLENEVFSLLANFFKRYYDNGDFVSMRRYKKDVYAIPYEGEEVKLHWANADQYYIKTAEYFKNYRFKLSNGNTISFELTDASIELNNNKIVGEKERRFAIYKEHPVEIAGKELKAFFQYQPVDKRHSQSDLLNEAFSTIKKYLINDFILALELRPTERDKQRTLIQKHLQDYAARNTFDYFIHKDLTGFLNRELDFYIKNEVLYIDDINTLDEREFLRNLSKIKTVKRIGEKVIAFLGQFENFQKKLWLKKKFIFDCNYCITLDRVPEELYPQIAENGDQIKEWKRLFGIDEIKASESNEIFGKKVIGFSDPLSVDFLRQNNHLLVDTRFYPYDFKWKVISSIDKFDERCSGLLISSENFQALNLLRTLHKEKVDVIYIDPPYNTDAGPIIYKNGFRNSTWITLLNDRLQLGKDLLQESGVLCCTIDDYEHKNLGLLMEQIFEDVSGTVAIRIKPSGRPIPNGFAVSHEYALFAKKSSTTSISRLKRDDDQLARYREQDEQGHFFWEMLRKAGSNSTNLDRPTMYFPLYLGKDGKLRLPNMTYDKVAEKYINIAPIGVGEIEIWPTKDNGAPGCWYFGYENMKLVEGELKAEIQNNGSYYVYYRRRPNEGVQPTSVWIDAKYSATEHGTALLKKLFKEHEHFSYPKSIFAVEDCLRVSGAGKINSVVLDYFAGSGTTGHAVINLNREDNGSRKYILVEMGTYFESVTKARIQKVIYSADWKDGRPSHNLGISNCFKYFSLEAYEDALNNLGFKQDRAQLNAIEENPAFKEGYMLNYMLDAQTEESLLNLEWFIDPFNCHLNITRNNEMKPTKVDMVETFNYLIGLVVESYAAPKKGFVVVTGKTLTEEKILVVWRDCNQHDNKSLNEFLQKSKYNPLDTEFDRIYVNGDNNVENLKVGEEKWKVVLIEEEFKKRMFENA